MIWSDSGGQGWWANRGNTPQTTPKTDQNRQFKRLKEQPEKILIPSPQPKVRGSNHLGMELRYRHGG
jgi:hypothetical protein